ncbi:MAG: hypothetical protein QNJ78_14880 [Gammaproteobacteria bacterium]|nr:hypothetical protein [Gammaproteobacteria bacterium]
MKTLNKALVAASFCLIATVPAFADHGHFNDRLFDRLERQHERIEDGIWSRELTRKEVKILKKQQRRIRQLFRVYRDDGRLSKRERRILRNKLDRASLKIMELKHNAVTRYTHLPRHHDFCCDHADDRDRGKGRKYRNRHAW